ncbi:MAG: hypothetical protein HFK10_06765 [Clostridia bacterium]|jgi:hypothetical protein|nr:hypothetical protein [Clostridia bacterium]
MIFLIDLFFGVCHAPPYSAVAPPLLFVIARERSDRGNLLRFAFRKSEIASHSLAMTDSIFDGETA